MNYIAEINAFNEWCEIHYLPMSSQFLWYKLMSKNNRLGWCEWVSVDNCELMGILGLKREQTAIDIRDKLTEAGLIEIIKGKKGIPNKYKMISLSNLKVHSAIKDNTLSDLKVNTVAESVVETVVNSVVETVAINKHKQNLNETEDLKDTPPTPRKRGKRTETVKPPKTQYAEFVSMTNDEYSSLVAKIGDQGTVRCVEILDNYKGANGKKYASDYHAILNWVVKRYEEELIANTKQAVQTQGKREKSFSEVIAERSAM